jgi:hypothetical protein
MWENWQPLHDALIMFGAGVIIVTWLIIEGNEDDD